MHYQLVIRTAAALVIVLGGSTSAAAQQDRGLALSAVGEAIGFRRTVMGDTLKVDACTLYRAVGEPGDFPAGIGGANLLSLDKDGPRPCDRLDAPTRFPYRVYVDSVAVSDTVGFVYLSVRRGEWLHRETFTLPRGRGGWGVREARVWGAIQFLPPPPP